MDIRMRATRPITRACLSVTSAFLLLCATLPAGAADEDPLTSSPSAFVEARAGSALLRMEDGERVQEPSLHERTATAFDDEGRLVDPRPFVDLAVLRMREAFGSEAVPIGSGGAVVGSHESGVVRVGLAAGDLDADGQAESLVVQLDIQTFVLTLEAVDGDGAPMWNRTMDLLEEGIYEFVPVFPGDLDGDGSDDVLLYGLRIFDDVGGFQCVPFAACVLTEQVSAEWQVALLDGATGADQADLRYPAFATVVAAVESLPAPTFTLVEYAQVENNLVYPVPAGDLDGDGGLDLVVVQDDLELVLVYSSVGALVAATFTYVASIHVDSDGTAVRGSDGGTLASYPLVRDAPDSPLVAPLGDVDGDGRGDLFVLVPDGSNLIAGTCLDALLFQCTDTAGVSGYALSARAAADGATIWEATEGGFHSFAIIGDGDGDGATDVALADGEAAWLRSGGDGTILWTRTQHGSALVHEVGDVDGDGRADVLVVRPFFVDEPLRLVVLSGASGATVYSSPVPLGPSSSLMLLDAGDQDGDGTHDLFVRAGSFSQRTFHLVTTGAAVLAWTIPGDGITWVAQGGDLDGDGDTDAVTTTRTSSDAGRTFSFTGRAENGTIIAGSTLELLAQSDAIAVGAGGSFDGDGTDDLLVSALNVMGPTVTSAVLGKDGGTGTTIFAVGDTLVGPGDIELPAQDDAGSGTDAPSSMSSGLPIVAGAYTGTLAPEAGDTADWYTFSAAAGASILVEMTPPAGSDFDLFLCYSDGQIAWCRIAGSSGDATEIIEHSGEAGDYSLGVDHWDGPGGNYTFVLSLNGSTGDAPPSFSRLDKNVALPGTTVRAMSVQNLASLARVTVGGIDVAHAVELASDGRSRNVVFAVPDVTPGLHEVRLENATGAGQGAMLEVVGPTDLAVLAVSAHVTSREVGDVAVPSGNLRIEYTIGNLGDHRNYSPNGFAHQIDVTIVVTPQDGDLSGHRDDQVFRASRLVSLAPGENSTASFEMDPRLRFVGAYDVTLTISYSPLDLDDTNDAGSTSFRTWVGGHGGV